MCHDLCQQADNVRSLPFQTLGECVSDDVRLFQPHAHRQPGQKLLDISKRRSARSLFEVEKVGRHSSAVSTQLLKQGRRYVPRGLLVWYAVIVVCEAYRRLFVEPMPCRKVFENTGSV